MINSIIISINKKLLEHEDIETLSNNIKIKMTTQKFEELLSSNTNSKITNYLFN